MDDSQFDWWRAARALFEAGEQKKIGRTPETTIHTDVAHSGYYRLRDRLGYRKYGPYVPVAIWLGADGNFRAKKDNMPVTREIPGLWFSCCTQPISYDEWVFYGKHGRWSTDPDPEAQPTSPGVGHNAPADPIEILKDEIASASAEVAKFAKFVKWGGTKAKPVPIVETLIKSQEDAEKAQAARSRLLELFRKGDKMYETEKEPIREQGREVDEKYRFRNEAQEKADIVRAGLEAFATEQLRLQRAAEQKAREEEEARKRIDEASDVSFMEDAPAEPEAAKPAPAAALPEIIQGSYGRGATTSTQYVVTEVKDYAALATFMLSISHSDLLACLRDLASRAAKAGNKEIPGCVVEEAVKVR